MRWLARLLRQKDGPTPSRPSGLRAFEPGELVDTDSLVMAHNEAVRHIEGLRVLVSSLVEERRFLISRIDHLEGKPSSTIGDPIEDHLKWAGVDNG